MSKVIVAHEKHGSRILAADGDRLPLHLCVKLIRERLERGWYSDDKDDEKAKAIIFDAVHAKVAEDDEDGHREKAWRKAWKFLESRSDGEYERLEVVEVEE